MIVELMAPPEVRRGERVRIELRVRNDTLQPTMLQLTGRPTAFDLIVTNAEGAEVWRRMHDAVVTMVLELRTLQPNEQLAFTHEWDQRDNYGRALQPGRYQVRGVLPCEPKALASELKQLVVYPALPP